jgi:hypothetical protein
MWTKRQNSHTSEYPERIDLIKSLLQKMLDQKMVGVWVHFELIKEAGWFKNLLSGNAPFLEVALADDDNFELNLGKPKDEHVNQITMPGNWKSEKKGCTVLLCQSCHCLLNGSTNFLRTRQVK